MGWLERRRAREAVKHSAGADPRAEDLRTRVNSQFSGEDLASRYIGMVRDAVSGRRLIGPVISRETWESGVDWPQPYPPVLSMIGRARLDELIECIRSVHQDNIRGDFVEAGVWRGGACILMRAMLLAMGDHDRRVVVADSFRGLPPPEDEPGAPDSGMTLHLMEELAVSRSAVERHFREFALLDDRVEFVEGFFKDALPALRGRTWAVLRLDGDMYRSTMDTLENLYPSLAVGGYCIVDDYGAYPACQRAVDEYRERNQITEPITKIDWTGVHWRRAS
jgi:O-methyltransferase